ncbi:MAG TPA: hypothetical protein PLW39_09225 [Thermoflexales bacterium]|nr:hypothetical protein [Thermoflexales bacterium]HQW35846.1 hypothetical protein [Thermoflexales bacterium]HQZ22435.1 hypothetical protein [Thermoflexales bacterium]
MVMRFPALVIERATVRPFAEYALTVSGQPLKDLEAFGGKLATTKNPLFVTVTGTELLFRAINAMLVHATGSAFCASCASTDGGRTTKAQLSTSAIRKHKPIPLEYRF